VSWVLSAYYRLRGKPAPYYARQPLWLLAWKIIRKSINVAIVPNIPCTCLRNGLYRMIGFKIGKNVFIGMRCYLDDVDPGKTIIEDNVVISYGCYFACHGKGQTHTTIRIKRGAYLGMRVNVVSGKEGVEIGEEAVVGAGALVNRSIPDHCVAVGVPARIIRRTGGAEREATEE